MAAGVVVSREVGVPRWVVWDLLWHRGRHVPPDPVPGSGPAPVPSPGSRVGLGGTLLTLDVVDPVDGFSGTAVWGGVVHRVTAHLVDRGSGTLLVLTADTDDPCHDGGPLLGGGGRAALARRHAARDLAALADRVVRGAGALVAGAATRGAVTGATVTGR